VILSDTTGRQRVTLSASITDPIAKVYTDVSGKIYNVGFTKMFARSIYRISFVY